MSDYAWFKLLVRAIGIMLIGFALPTLIWTLAHIVLEAVPGSPMNTSRPVQQYLLIELPAIASYGVQAFLGWYLLFRGEWIIGRVLAEVNGRCAKCGYDIRGLKADACPECNTPIRRAKGEGDGRSPE